MNIKPQILILLVLSIISCQNGATTNSNNTEKYKGYSSYIKDSDLHFLTNYQEGLECAKQNNFPIFLLFTAHGLGDNEFSSHLVNSKRIRKILNNKCVTVILYVDDNQKLSDSLQVRNLELQDKSIEAIKEKNTIGALNAFIQIDKFQSNNQPFYVLMTSEEEQIIEPSGYTSRDEKKFFSRLSEGLKR
jgi:hypothetical protein